MESTINFESLIVSQSNLVRQTDNTSDIKRFNRIRKLSDLKKISKYNWETRRKFESDDRKRRSTIKYIIRNRRRYINKIQKEMLLIDEWEDYDD